MMVSEFNFFLSFFFAFNLLIYLISMKISSSVSSPPKLVLQMAWRRSCRLLLRKNAALVDINLIGNLS